MYTSFYIQYINLHQAVLQAQEKTDYRSRLLIRKNRTSRNFPHRADAERRFRQTAARRCPPQLLHKRKGDVS